MGQGSVLDIGAPPGRTAVELLAFTPPGFPGPDPSNVNAADREEIGRRLTFPLRGQEVLAVV